MKKRSVIANTSKEHQSVQPFMATDRRFFDALIHSDVEALDRILSDDFIIIDVLKGAETTKPEIIGAIGSGFVRFEKIEIRDNRVRLYDRTAVITGQTQMTVRFSGTVVCQFRAGIRMCIANWEAKWRLVSAQGTSIQAHCDSKAGQEVRVGRFHGFLDIGGKARGAFHSILFPVAHSACQRFEFVSGFVREAPDRWHHRGRSAEHR